MNLAALRARFKILSRSRPGARPFLVREAGGLGVAGAWGRRHRPGVHGAEGLSGCPAPSNLAFVRALARGDRAALVWWRVARFLVLRWGGYGGRAPGFGYGDFVRDHAAPVCFDRLVSVLRTGGRAFLGSGSGVDLVGVAARLCLPCSVRGLVVGFLVSTVPTGWAVVGWIGLMPDPR